MGHANAFAATRKLIKIATRVNEALETWRLACETMPPIRNVSLRDTLMSIGDIKSRYDTYFAAHEVPCDIQYQLSAPIDESLRGIDYIQAWLNQLLRETQYIAQFTPESCIAALEQSCPDYKRIAREPIRPSCSTRKRTQAKRESRPPSPTATD